MNNSKNEPREVLLIGGPADGVIYTVINPTVSTICVPIQGKALFGIPRTIDMDKYEYTIKKCQDGTWIGE